MKSIVTLVAIAIMASPSFAATTKKTNTHNVKNAETHNNTYTNTTSAPGNVAWNAGLGLGTAATQFHFGVMLSGMVPVSTMQEGQILVGGQTGFLFGPGTVSTWIIPILAAGQFNFRGNGKITPYAGLAMGIGIGHASVGAISGTDTAFTLLAKGGLYFGQEQKLYAELPLGTMGNSFAIFPSFGMKF